MADKAKLKVLYVEDEPDLRERIRIVLEMHFETVVTAVNGKEGLEAFRRERPDIVVCDIRMPIMDGLQMTLGVRESAPETPVILCTAFTETNYLLKAIEMGVSAYVRKPLDCRQLVETIARTATPILQKRELEQVRQREQVSLELLLGESRAMRDVIRQAQRIAESDFSVIIQGETGVGKSYLASLIHGLSKRRTRMFLTISVNALPESLVESHLFGHIRGAFTGAVSTVKGLFEEANGGTLFLDDIDCAPLAIQAKILHAVEQKTFFPVGGTKEVIVDTRVIAASNRILLDEVRSGNFREDLYYRLGELLVTLPPLRDRGDDILSLARAFLTEISHDLQRIPPRMAPDAILLLTRYPWPGNVRELKSVMKRAALFAGETLTGDSLTRMMSLPDDTTTGTTPLPLQTLEELKRDAVKRALIATGGKKMEAARLLNVDYSSFKRMLEKYKL